VRRVACVVVLVSCSIACSHRISSLQIKSLEKPVYIHDHFDDTIDIV